MSENTHIDKIFKEGIGEMNFSNADVMWQQMEAELDKEKGKKKRPIVFFALLATLLAAGIFTFNHFNKTTPAETVAAETKTIAPVTAGNSNATVNKEMLQGKDNAVDKVAPAAATDIAATGISLPITRQSLTVQDRPAFSLNSNIPAEPGGAEGGADKSTTETAAQQNIANENSWEKITVQPDLMALPQLRQPATTLIPVSQNIITKPAERKKEIAKANTITIEAVAGGDLLRLNRKAGYYAGIRVNKHVEEGTVISVGVNYASHTVLDKYRVATKPAEQRSSDARINSITSIRMPVYLQRQMGQSKFAMMIGLVPAYITKAEVYNVPDSYIGDPNPYRKFGLNDINRFNLLFGAGIKYSPFNNWLSFELSGNYALTGLVKDGYKNLSRVNDNFKSIQLGVALRFK